MRLAAIPVVNQGGFFIDSSAQIVALSEIKRIMPIVRIILQEQGDDDDGSRRMTEVLCGFNTPHMYRLVSYSVFSCLLLPHHKLNYN